MDKVLVVVSKATTPPSYRMNCSSTLPFAKKAQPMKVSNVGSIAASAPSSIPSKMVKSVGA